MWLENTLRHSMAMTVYPWNLDAVFFGPFHHNFIQNWHDCFIIIGDFFVCKREERHADNFSSHMLVRDVDILRHFPSDDPATVPVVIAERQKIRFAFIAERFSYPRLTARKLGKKHLISVHRISR